MRGFDEDLGAEKSLRSGRSKKPLVVSKVLKAVAIPASGSVSAHLANGPITSSPSSLSSYNSSTRDHSSEYDTPGTSLVATPAELSAPQTKTKTTSAACMATSKVSSSSRAKELRTSKYSLSGTTTKRTRQQVDDEEILETSTDARLARTLQEQEYGVGAPKRARLSHSARKEEIEISSDDSDALSSVSRPESVVPSRRATKASARFSLPRRAARDSAKESIKENAVFVISDSDKPEISNIISDTDSSLSDWDSNDDLSEAESVSQSLQAAGSPGSGARNRNRRGTTRTGFIPVTRPRVPVTRRGHSSRVSRVSLLTVSCFTLFR